jgi:nucleotide-binding universal stress UspA family protein
MLILVPTAGSVPAQSNAEYIVNIAKNLASTLLVIHITEKKPTPDGKKALDIFKAAGEKQGVEIRTEVVKGNIVDKILDIATEKKADLIIMGASHGIIVHEWLATTIIDKSKVPVVIIPYGLEDMDVN